MAGGHSWHSIALAALLHDIGQFKQRVGGAEDRGRPHDQIGFEWLRGFYGEGIIATAALKHHGSAGTEPDTNFGLLFAEADDCASVSVATNTRSESDLDIEWHSRVQLANVFSRIRNPNRSGNNEKPPPSFTLIAPSDRWPQPSTTEGNNGKETYGQLWDAFLREFEALHRNGYHQNVEAVLHLLEKYTSFIPSISLRSFAGSDEKTYRDQVDVSLFDHLRITAAAAVCLAHYHSFHNQMAWDKEIASEPTEGDGGLTSTESPFLLIGGDLSGIQKFIYTISSKGALKALKGRSFFLEMLVEHTVDRLIEEIGLARPNVIFTGGGRFYLLGPNISATGNSPSTEQRITNVRDEINDYLFEAFGGALQLSVKSVPFGKEDFKNSSAIWTKLSGKLAETKYRKWETRIDKLFGVPQMPHSTCLTANCAVCGREDLQLVELTEEEAETKVCSQCQEQYSLGYLIQSSFRRGDHPVIYMWTEKPETGRSIRIGNRYYQLQAGRLGKDKDWAASAVFHLNDWNVGNFTHPRSRPLIVGVYLPEDEASRELEGMANRGFGMARLAALKMDVDNLGRIFSYAVPEGERSFSQMASISRQLNVFFKYHINNLMLMESGYTQSRSEFPITGERKLSIIYAGGDDLFLIGHWLDATRAAFDIKTAFARYTANPYMTLSAGLALGYSHDPVYRLAEEAGKMEKQAKEKTRNAISLFDGRVFGWPETDQILSLVKQVMGLCELGEGSLELPPKSLTKSVLYRVYSLTKLHSSTSKWFIPKLAYTFGRSSPKDEPFAQIWGQLKNLVFSYKFNWGAFEEALLWVLMMMRKGD
ncbi:MAG: type III-A CRISPR-associated protein Cas10/Csm1 [Syntrophobacteraceae bacterium]|jgi:CRISPR-associated protein Csm1